MKIIIYIALIIILIINIFIFSNYNKLIYLLNRVKKAQASIEIYLNKRFELIPNLVECVKGYSKYEGDTLENIVSLRKNYSEEKSIDIKKASKMNNDLTKYLAIVEAYPELKADSQYMNLQKELKNIEDELENARHRYNDVVTNYNTTIESVPSNIVASIFGFNKAELFQVESNKKENVKVEL
ncbi:MAG: LemA family protein [Bacilli bacterium]|nr:LemA family protein [Bacilli bacterium]